VNKYSPRSVSIGFALATLCKVAFIVSCAMQYALLLRAPVSAAEAHANDARQQAIARLTVPIALIAILFFFIWLHRIKKAEISLGMTDSEYSPGFSIGCFFIPIANFALPFQAVRELWKGSLNPGAWKTQPSSPLVGWWWAAWLAYALTPIAVLGYAKLATGLNGLKITTILLAISALFSVVSYALTIVLARRVSEQLASYIAQANGSQTHRPDGAGL